MSGPRPFDPDRDLAARFHDPSQFGLRAHALTALDESEQKWRCRNCRALRTWGWGEPSSFRPVFLICEGDCGGVTVHVYAVIQ